MGVCARVFERGKVRAGGRVRLKGTGAEKDGVSARDKDRDSDREK